MAKTSAVEKNKHRQALTKRYAAKRAREKKKEKKKKLPENGKF